MLDPLLQHQAILPQQSLGSRTQSAPPTPPSFFFTLGTGPRMSLSLTLSDTRVYEPQIRARLGATCAACLSGEPRSADHLVEAVERRCSTLAV